jgi:hypothetical protein
MSYSYVLGLIVVVGLIFAVLLSKHLVTSGILGIFLAIGMFLIAALGWQFMRKNT